MGLKSNRVWWVGELLAYATARRETLPHSPWKGGVSQAARLAERELRGASCKHATPLAGCKGARQEVWLAAKRQIGRAHV